MTAVDLASGVQTASITAGAATIATSVNQTASSVGAAKVTLESSTGADLSVTGKADLLEALGLTTATGRRQCHRERQPDHERELARCDIADGSTLNVDGHVITFKNAPTPGSTGAPSVPSGYGASGAVVTDGNGNSTVYLQAGTVNDVLKAIDLATGVQTATVNANGTATLATATGQTNSSVNASGQLKISTGVNADLSITGTGNALNVLGFAGNTGTATAFTAARTSGVGGITGKTLTFSSFNAGTAVNVTFGDGTNGTVKTLDQLNAALQANNLTATHRRQRLADDLDHQRLRVLDARVGAGGRFDRRHAHHVADLLDRFRPRPGHGCADRPRQPGQPVQQHPAADQHDLAGRSFNGVNLLNGDQLKLVFDETGKSSLNITGVTFNSSGSWPRRVDRGVDFIDNAATNKVLPT